MSITEVTSHFWVARPPFFSSTLLLACEEGEGRVTTTLTLFDVEGVQINEVEVEFPAGEVGIVELEPFSAALKMQGEWRMDTSRCLRQLVRATSVDSRSGAT